MKYKFRYPNKFAKFFDNIIVFLYTIIIEILIILAIDIVLYLPIFIITGEIYGHIQNATKTPEYISYAVLIAIVVIEFTTMIVVEVKRRFTYCELKSYGLYIYNNNFMKFGYGVWYKRNATIPYSQIERCYISTAKNLPRYYFKHTWWCAFIRHFKTTFSDDCSYEYIPAITYGDLKGDCVFVELKNKIVIVLPLDDCEEFIDSITTKI